MLTIATLIPAFNAAEFIEAALDSVASQTRPPKEIIVVNDGSTDGTSAVVRQWSSHYRTAKVKLIEQDNLGASAARNVAIRAARSDLIAFLDADDMLEPEHHAELLRALQVGRDVVAAFGDQSVYSECSEECESFLARNAQKSLEWERRESSGVFAIEEGLWGILINGNIVPTSASITYRELAIKVGMFDETLKTSEDRDFWLRVSRRGAFSCSPSRLARKRSHANNLSDDGGASRCAFDVVLKQLDNA
jgi:glycosyltransferase involved in cell wall biosynthesis